MKEDHIFWPNGRVQKKEQMKEDDIYWSNDHVHTKEINQQGPQLLVE